MIASCRFVILTAGRSGSNFLYSALRSHPEVCCFGEVLETPEPHELADKNVSIRPRRPRERAHEFLLTTVFEACSHRAVGCKLKYWHVRRSGLLSLVETHGVRVVHSVRHNVLAQAVSVPLAEAHAFVDEIDDKLMTGRYSRKIYLDIADVLRRAQWIRDERARLDRALHRRAAQILEIAYEESCLSDAAGTVAQTAGVERLLAFLGLSHQTLHTRHRRQRTLPYTQLISNLDELREAILQDYPWFATDLHRMTECDLRALANESG